MQQKNKKKKETNICDYQIFTSHTCQCGISQKSHKPIEAQRHTCKTYIQYIYVRTSTIYGSMCPYYVHANGAHIGIGWDVDCEPLKCQVSYNEFNIEYEIKIVHKN